MICQCIRFVHLSEEDFSVYIIGFVHLSVERISLVWIIYWAWTGLSTAGRKQPQGARLTYNHSHCHRYRHHRHKSPISWWLKTFTIIVVINDGEHLTRFFWKLFQTGATFGIQQSFSMVRTSFLMCLPNLVKICLVSLLKNYFWGHFTKWAAQISLNRESRT